MKRFILTWILFWLALPLFLRAGDWGWRIVGEMPVPVKGARAVLKDSMIYVIGGYTDQTYAATRLIQKFDPVRNQWQVLDDTLRTARYGLSAVGYRNSVLMFGGTADIDSTLEVWDYRGATYIYDQQNIFLRRFATAQVNGNYLYIFGGLLPNGAPPAPYLVEYYIPGAKVTFSRNSSYPDNANSNVDAVQQMSALIQGNIFVIGGALNGILKDIYRFDIAQLDWQKTDAVLLEERAAGAAVPLFDRSIAVIGGYNESRPALATCEQIFIEDSQITHQQPMPKLNIARSELTAVAFDTTLFVFGGADELGNTVAQVEALHIEPQATSLRTTVNLIPKKLHLWQNFPNPFNQNTVIRFYLDRKQPVHLDIFDLAGRKIRTLLNTALDMGPHRVVWSGRNDSGKEVPSGIYFYRLWASGRSLTARMVMLR